MIILPFRLCCQLSSVICNFYNYLKSIVFVCRSITQIDNWYENYHIHISYYAFFLLIALQMMHHYSTNNHISGKDEFYYFIQ